MKNLVDVTYAQTGESTSVDRYGMREMQAAAFEKRDAQYLLLKAPPASGKSRALMFLALDKLFNQGRNKVIVAVPEHSIGASFAPTALTDHGFFADWDIRPEYNLCTPGATQGKVAAFRRFLESDAATLVCTHATLRFAAEHVTTEQWDTIVLAIDEFHHVSAADTSILGNVLRDVMADTDAHIIAMTGSYFRGDAVPVLAPEDEAKFDKVTYNYYQQLNGYEHLKSLGIGYHFYSGRYTDAINEVLDTDKKTIVHIPAVQSGESTKDKYAEVDAILDHVGTDSTYDTNTGVLTVTRPDGRRIRVADLVQDEDIHRAKITTYLRTIENPEDIDLIIALNMAKEGFDWPWCEHALTVGYRGSLTEIIQIIGRCTRDSPGKSHAQFTNLIAEPDAETGEVAVAVNNMLKAITASLLMEQVVAPNFTFRTKRTGDPDTHAKGDTELRVGGYREPSTDRARQILTDDMTDLKARIFQDDAMLQAMPGNVDPEVMNKVLVPRIIRDTYPDLTEDEVEEVRQGLVTDAVVKNSDIRDHDGKKFVLMASKFVNIDELHIDLIDRVNPFQHAFEILSKQVTAATLRSIMQTIDASKIEITDEEAEVLWPKARLFATQNGRPPELRATDPLERRLAAAVAHIRKRAKEEGL